MILELIFAAYIVEAARATYYHVKEWRRDNRLHDRFIEILHSSKSVAELAEKCNADKLNNPELYKKIPPTWMGKILNKMVDDKE